MEVLTRNLCSKRRRYVTNVLRTATALVVATGCARGEAFLWENGQMIGLGSPTEMATSINDAGQVVGDTYGTGLGFLWQNGVLNTPLFPMAGQPTGINSSGLIVGGTGDANGMQVGAIFNSGSLTLLGDLPGDNRSFAFGVNDSGQVVGSSDLVTGNQFTNQHTFIWQAGVFTDLGLPSGYVDSSPNAINSDGDVVGYLTNPSGQRSAYLYQNGQFITLNSLLPPGSGWDLTDAQDLNNSDEVVGFGYLNGVGHGFLYSNGSITDLGTDFASSQAINDEGQIVGGDFLWSNGVITSLGGITAPPGDYDIASQTVALAINDLGEVVGYAESPTPIPEPNSVSLFAGGLGLLCLLQVSLLVQG
jgi:probable HAF family extracellular repeat protein